MEDENDGDVQSLFLRGNTSVTSSIFGHFFWVEGKVVRKNALRMYLAMYLRGASPVNGSKNRYFFFIIIRLHMHSEIRM